MKKSEIVETASKLSEMAPRRGKMERKAAELIEEKIANSGFNPRHQEYDVVYPQFGQSRLEVDGEKIECLPGGFQSGEIKRGNLVNSVHNGQGSVDRPAISFNPYADDVSVTTFYDAPVVAIDPSEVGKVIEADKVEGLIEVKWRSDKSSNILVGNTQNPEKIILAHYDSLWGGFIDNGFSVSLLLHMLNEIDLRETLIVFAGSEEVSQESPYHCYGYRRFESCYTKQLEAAEEIKVIDSLGRGSQEVIQDPEIVEKAIVFSQGHLIDKTDLLASRYQDVLDIYHSPSDTKDKLTSYSEAVDLVKREVL